MKNKFLNYLERFCIYLLDIKNYSILTVKTYKTPITKAIEVSEIYEEDNTIIFDITKYRLQIALQNKKTINKKLSTIRSFISFLEDQNIAIKLIGASSVKSEQTLPKPIKESNILEAIENIDDETKLIITLIYSFGLRISELQNLQIKNIANKAIIVQGKGNKERQIPANDIVWDMLQKYISFHRSNIFLFEKDGKALTSRQLQYKIDKAFKNIGVKATPHQLRHSFATDLLNNGARIVDISELLGHSSLKATGIYTKLNTITKLKQYNNSHPLSQL